MKRYGNEPTKLVLNQTAQRVYNNTDPLDIYELDNGTYKITGCLEADNLTAEQVNTALIEFAKETEEAR